MTYPCGCVNEPDPEWGVLRNVSKCDYHAAVRARQPKGRRYYRGLGVFRHPGNHRRELEDALGPLPPAAAGSAVEIGGGASQYVPAVRRAGYSYVGVEPNSWAADWTARTYGVTVVNAAFPCEHAIIAAGSYDLVLSAHAVEHMPHAPDALAAMQRLLRPGGFLVLVVPDDEDPVNPDHYWFFTPDTLLATLERVGFAVRKLEMRRRVRHENFLYVLAGNAACTTSKP
jgi:SAM-dependent methyltransferase